MSKFSQFWQGMILSLLALLSENVIAEHHAFIQRGAENDDHSGVGDMPFTIFKTTSEGNYLVILPHGSGKIPTFVPGLAQENVINKNTNIAVTCRNGSGVDYVRIRLNSIGALLRPDQKSPYTGVNGEPLLFTTVPGVFLSLGLSYPSVDGDTSYFTDPEKLYYFPFTDTTDQSLWTFRENRNCGGPANDKRVGEFYLKVTSRFYVNSDFKPTTGQQFTGGQYWANLYSDDGSGSADARLLFNIAGFNVSSPTCVLSSVTSTESNALTSNDGSGTSYTLALGSYSPSAIKNGSTQKVPFRLRLQGCMGVTTLGVEVSGSTTTDGKLFANTTAHQNGGADNVAVKLRSVQSAVESEIYPGRRLEYSDSSASGVGVINTATGEVTMGSDAGAYDMDFNAQLVQVDTGQPIQPGKVTGRTTFLFNYP